MKKFFLSLIIGLLVNATLYSQTASPEPAANVMSIEQAKALSGHKEPMINGKPYSQYKAEQEALKQQRERQQQSASEASAVALKPGQAKPAAVQQTSVPKFENDGYTPAPAKPQAEVVVAKAEQPKPKAATPDLANPAALTSVRGNAPSNNAAIPAAGDAGHNVPAGAQNGVVISGVNKSIPAQPKEQRSPAEIEKAKQIQEAADKAANAPNTTNTATNKQ